MFHSLNRYSFEPFININVKLKVFQFEQRKMLQYRRVPLKKKNLVLLVFSSMEKKVTCILNYIVE